jgi:zinc protease
MMTANSWFGEHRNSFSHLYQVIRDERGMNYGDYSYIEAFPQGYTTQQPPVNAARRSHLFEVWIRPISLTDPDNLHERSLFATRAAMRELEALVETGMTEDGGDVRGEPRVPPQLHPEIWHHGQPPTRVQDR